jgi:hypothetical protein
MCQIGILSGQVASWCFYPDSPNFRRKTKEDPQVIGSGQVFHPGIQGDGRPDRSSGSGKPDMQAFYTRYDHRGLRVTSEFPVGGFRRFGGSFGLPAVILPAG